jgi:flagellin
MPQIINTNIASLNAQRNLNRTQSDLAVSLQRLSTGLRINSAKDDAAGLAISQRMTTQITGLNQAVRNANDGVSLAQTAEGAMSELTNNLQRIRELAVQSANATNSASDRAALDLEVKQRLAEVDRIASQTSFNGLKVLDGSFGSATFQIGANVGETIQVTLGTDTSMRTSSLGAIAAATSGDLSAVISEATDAVANTSGASGTYTAVALTTGQTFSLTVDGVSVFTHTAAGNETVAAQDIQDALDDTTVQGNLATAGITVSGTVAGGNLTFTQADGTAFNIVVANAGTNGFAGADFATGTNAVDNGAAAAAAVELTLATGDFSVQVGENDAVDIVGTFSSLDELATAISSVGNGAIGTVVGNTVKISAPEKVTLAGTEAQGSLDFAALENDVSGSLDTVSVATADGANDAMLRVDSALTSVNTLRGTFGAMQNRFESTIANLSAVSENLSAARSRIMDADFAAETASMTRAQILQQAGVSILSQANSLPQMVLQLLQG